MRMVTCPTISISSFVTTASVLGLAMSIKLLKNQIIQTEERKEPQGDERDGLSYNWVETDSDINQYVVRRSITTLNRKCDKALSGLMAEYSWFEHSIHSSTSDVSIFLNCA